MKNKKAFTLVEFISTIIIVIVLASIWFYSFLWYFNDAKDSKRLIELDNIVASIETYQVWWWRLPIPDESRMITYSGATVWQQWVFWEETSKILWYSKKLVLDPNEISKYTYSINNKQKEYSLAWVLENDKSIISKNISTINYNDWLRKWNAIIRWNYNWVITHVNTGAMDYILAVPSIVSTNLLYTDLVNILDNNKLVLNGFENLPASYSWSKFRVESNLDFAADNLLIYSWSLSIFSDEEERLSLLYVLQKTYSWSLSLDNGFLSSIIENDIDLIYPDETDLDLSCDLINSKLNYKIDCDYINLSSFYIINNPNIITAIDFSILSWLQVNYIYQEWNNLRFWTNTWAFSCDLTTNTWTTYEETEEYKITVIVKDNDNNMWFWTSDSWLLVYENKTDWLNYQSDYDPPHVNSNHFYPITTTWIPSNAIYDIIVDLSGNVIIWTHNWWSYYDGTFHDFYIYNSNNHYLYSENRLKNLLIDHNNYIWLATDKWAYLYKWWIADISSGTFIVYNWTNWLPYTSNKFKVKVNTIFEDSNYNMRFWTIYGIWKLNVNLNPVKKYTTITWEWLANNDIKSIFEDLNTSNMWFWTNEWVSVLSGSIFTNYTKDIDWEDLWVVFYIYQDDNWLNILWTQHWTTTIE